MLNMLIYIALSIGHSSTGALVYQSQTGERVTVYGAGASKSAKARNAWNRLNLSPAGVEVKIMSKRGAL